jgi:DNA-binding NarL/FixJ family response regulator
MSVMTMSGSYRPTARSRAITERTVEAHTTQIFLKLDLEVDPESHRRVLAVLTLLRT